MKDDDYAREHAAEQFDATMSAVRRHFDREEFEKALPLCVKAYETRPECPVVRRCRVFALLSLSRWSDALQVCEKLACEEDSFAFERAYCFYRLNKFQEALDALKNGGDDDDGGRHRKLEAQIRYRMGSYDDCAEMYERLYEEDAEETGLLVNALASRVSGDEPRKAIKLMATGEELLESSYELCFNLACAHIDEGKLSEAEARLQEAKKICIEELLAAEELGEEDAALFDDHEELAAINVQRALVLQRMGGAEAREEANTVYNNVLRQRAGQDREVDVTVLAVACNNVVALRSEGKSLFDSLKRINVASKESLEHKLTRKQTIEIGINKCLLLLQASRLDEARRELQRLHTEYPGHPRVAIVQAAMAFREKKAKGAEESFQAYLAEHPGSEEVLICLAQLHVLQNRHDKAAEALAQLSRRSRAQPHTVEAIVALYQRQKCPEKAVACLREAIEYWTKEEGDADEELLASVLRIAARLGNQLKDRAFAAEAFQLYLERVDGSDVEALCGLVRALASTDPERAEEYAQRLRVPEYGHLDPEELETQAIPKVAQHMGPKRRGGADKEAGGEDGAAGGEEAAKEVKKKKKRKPRYPKGFDPENPGPPPDPERWLPKRERAEFKKKLRKRDKNLARGPQGSMPTDDTAFRKQGPSTAQIDLSKESASRPKGNQGRKAKGKK